MAAVSLGLMRFTSRGSARVREGPGQTGFRQIQDGGIELWGYNEMPPYWYVWDF